MWVTIIKKNSTEKIRSGREDVFNPGTSCDFSVLFFFMIVTHMRQVTLKVDCRLPQGKELTRLTKKSAVSHIYIGKPTKEMQAKYGTGTQIQLNDKFASAPEVMDYISAEKKRMSPEDQKLMTVSIKADQETKMGVITDVKQALRQAKALKISYSDRKSVGRERVYSNV